MALIDGIYAYFKFDNSLTDEEGNLTLTDNNTANDASGKINQGRAFTAGDYLTYDEDANMLWNTSGDAASFEFWFKTSTTGVDQYIMTYRPTGGNVFCIVFVNTSNKVRFLWRDSAGNSRDMTSTSTYTDGVYHHVVCTMNYNGSNFLYIDGGSANGGETLSSSTSYTGDLSLNNSGNTYDYWVIGANFTLGTPDFIGTLDEWGLWNARALSSSEVTELWSGGDGLAYPFSAVGGEADNALFFGGGI